MTDERAAKRDAMAELKKLVGNGSLDLRLSMDFSGGYEATIVMWVEAKRAVGRSSVFEAAILAALDAAKEAK